MPAADFGDSRDLVVGQLAVAVGSLILEELQLSCPHLINGDGSTVDQLNGLRSEVAEEMFHLGLPINDPGSSGY